MQLCGRKYEKKGRENDGFFQWPWNHSLNHEKKPNLAKWVCAGFTCFRYQTAMQSKEGERDQRLCSFIVISSDCLLRFCPEFGNYHEHSTRDNGGPARRLWPRLINQRWAGLCQLTEGNCYSGALLQLGTGDFWIFGNRESQRWVCAEAQSWTVDETTRELSIKRLIRQLLSENECRLQTVTV